MLLTSVDIPQADVKFTPGAFPLKECDRDFQARLHGIPWQQDTIEIDDSAKIITSSNQLGE